jgi:hypothetical protein
VVGGGEAETGFGSGYEDGFVGEGGLGRGGVMKSWEWRKRRAIVLEEIRW